MPGTNLSLFVVSRTAWLVLDQTAKALEGAGSFRGPGSRGRCTMPAAPATVSYCNDSGEDGKARGGGAARWTRDTGRVPLDACYEK